MAIYRADTRGKDSKLIRFGFFGFVSFFTAVGMVFSVVFVSMQYGALNVRGTSTERNEFYESLPKNSIQSAELPQVKTLHGCLEEQLDGTIVASCNWNQSKEWEVIRAGLKKDADVIIRVAEETNVSPRMIAAAVVPEQLRFFTSERESYKRYFEPLKILGSMSKFSLGVAGLKYETAKKVEQFTVDINSQFYPGEDLSGLIEYAPGENRDAELYNRLTDKDHYYSYVYTALYIREIQAHWQSEGFDITERPDVIVTLFNIGFDNSRPKATPQIGGSAIYLNGESYTFGELGTAFYLSDELNLVFEK